MSEDKYKCSTKQDTVRSGSSDANYVSPLTTRLICRTPFRAKTKERRELHSAHAHWMNMIMWRQWIEYAMEGTVQLGGDGTKTEQLTIAEVREIRRLGLDLA
jgi:hypothetical protein